MVFLTYHKVRKKRRGWDSNPRSPKARPLFESGTINHSDTSPRYELYPRNDEKAKIIGVAIIEARADIVPFGDPSLGTSVISCKVRLC